MKVATGCVLTAALAGCASAQTPSPRTIEAIEGGYFMLLDLKGGGVAPIDVLNAGPQVKVRDVSCRASGRTTAVCTYTVDRCLAVESDHDGDGWCRRTEKFVRTGTPSDPYRALLVNNGWTVDHPE
jgi:hypothetical protein